MKRSTHSSDEFNRDREFAVILERIHSDIKILIEDNKSTKERVNMLWEEFGRQKETIYMIKADINGHDKRLTVLEEAAKK